MKHKILVADDSLTIQKVIKITLASEPFELVECTDAKDLIQNTKDFKPNIVLLDFNLSEDKTGYDLANDIKKILPNVKILMLFGTFDTIDESLLNSSGVSHKIVKPFDGTKFINLCRVMAQDLDLESADSIHEEEDDFSMESPVQMPEVIEEEPEVIEEDEDDQWVMDSPDVEDEDEEIEIEVSQSSEKELNPLEANMQDWGMDVPGIIGGDSDHLEIPEVIDELDHIEMKNPTIDNSNKVEKVEVQGDEEESVLPSSDDLAYPDMIDLGETNSESLDIESKHEEKSKLVPLESLESLDENKPIVEVESKAGGTETDDDLESLRAQIEDEVEEDDLWSADEYEASTDENNDGDTSSAHEEEINLMNVDDLPHIEPHNLREVKEEDFEDKSDDAFDFEEEDYSTNTPDDFPNDVMEEYDSPLVTASKKEPATEVNLPEDFEERLKEKLTPIMEEFIKEYCRENIEKIAWEVIPDLAENLIKKEIKKISNSVLNS